MRILIVDVTRDFGLFTPYEKPLGGLQSGLCYLAHQLSLQGHDITIVNACAEAHDEQGVHFLPWNTGWPGAANMDVIIVTAATGEMMRHWQSLYGRKPLWLLWVHYDTDQHAISLLADTNDRDLFDGFLFVSDWQAEEFRKTFGILWDRSFVLRNAVSPTFHGLYQPDEAILPSKSADPVLVYTSTPYRGLEPLLDAVPLIREQIPNARFRIFSSWAVYGRSDEQDPHHALYERCRSTPGVDYIGSVPQTELARHLKEAWCVAYPSIFRETSCIAVMEGLAAGCKVVTSHLAALPETTFGFGALVINPKDHQDLARRFADLAVRVIRDFQNSPETMERELRASVDHAHTHLSWAVRAAQLGEWLSARRGLYDRALQAAGETRPPSETRVRRMSDHTILVQTPRGGFITEGAGESLIGRTLGGFGEWMNGICGLLDSILKPGDVVADVGAHIGTLTVPMARAVGETGRVIAFEPQVKYFHQLQANVTLNDLPQVQPYNVLVGNGGRWAAAAAITQLPGAAGAWSTFMPVSEGQDGLEAVSLDRVPGLDTCRLIRISTPGMLPQVIEGATALISRTRPMILCEINSAWEFSVVRDRLMSMGYLLHWQCGDLFPAQNAFGSPLGDLPPLGVLYMLAVPMGAGIFSPLPPALFPDDPAHIFSARLLGFYAAQGGQGLPMADGRLESFEGNPDGLQAKWQDNAVLRSLLVYLLAQANTAAEPLELAVWAEFSSIFAGRDEPARLLVMGDDGVPSILAAAVTAKARGARLIINAARHDGFVSQSVVQSLSLLTWVFAIPQDDVHVLNGADLTAVPLYDVAFSRTAQDAAAAARSLKSGGVLIMAGDDAVDLPLWLTIGGVRLFRK